MTDSNATNERTISVDLPDYPSDVVEFYLVSSIAISGAEVFPTLLYSLTLDANGVGTIELPTPDGDGTLAWLWHIKLPDGKWATDVTLAWGAGTLALSTWLAAAASTATPSDLLGQYVQLAGDTMTGLLTLSGAPTASLHAATKAYADSVAGVTPDVDDVTTDTGNATEMVRVDGAGTGLEYQTEAQVLANIGAAAAADLTTHEADTTNPHSVTAAQVDALPEDAVINAQSGTYEVVAGDAGKIIEGTGTWTLTLPDGLAVGFQVAIVNVSSGTITLAAATTLQSKAAAVTLATQYAGCVVYHRGSNVWLAMGDLE